MLLKTNKANAIPLTVSLRNLRLLLNRQASLNQLREPFSPPVAFTQRTPSHTPFRELLTFFADCTHSKWRRIYPFSPASTQPLYVNISNKNAPLLFAFISKENIHAKYCDCNTNYTIYTPNSTLTQPTKLQCSMRT